MTHVPASSFAKRSELISLASTVHESRPVAMRVAIAETDKSQAELLDHHLRRGGHDARYFERAGTLIQALRGDSFDALILDWNLLDISGVEVLRRIRSSEQSSMPILVSGARASKDEDVVNALRHGADDYMVKPVRCLELVARLEAIARRSSGHMPQAQPLTVGLYHVDAASRTLMCNGRPIELTTKDFDLSVLFLRNVGNLLSRDYIREHLWGRRDVVASRTLDTHVCHVRLRLGFTSKNGWNLAAKYGRGYCLRRLNAATLE
jgi:DNA-binding response OmpR family regulator